HLAAGRLAIGLGAAPDRGLRHAPALAQPEHRSQSIDMDLEACGLARTSEPVAHLLVLGPERQAPHAPLRSGAEFCGFVNSVPEAAGIGLQSGCGFYHFACRMKLKVHK